MGLDARRINYRALYSFNNSDGKWYLIKRPDNVFVSYSLLDGKVLESHSGRINKKDCKVGTLSLTTPNGESETIQMDNLHPTSFEIKDDTFDLICSDIFSSCIGERTIAYAYSSKKIMGRNVFDQEYPLLCVFKFDEDDKISECTCGVIIGVDNANKPNSIKVKGWHIDKDSCSLEECALLGNMEAAQVYTISIDRPARWINNRIVIGAIMNFTNDPLGYFKEESKKPRKHKSIFDKNGR